MKMFYTKDELSSLKVDELKELVSFGQDSTGLYFYSDVKSLRLENGEGCILFKNGEEVYTQTIDTYNKILQGKLRFDLISQTVAEHNADVEVKNQFYNEVKNNNERLINGILTKLQSDMSVLMGNVNQTLQGVNDVSSNIKSIDPDTFDRRMKKLDKILNAFGTLLED